MATLSDLARQHTALDSTDEAHLHRLVGEWGLLADFCFADLLLYAPTGEGRWVVLAQVRPVTAQTMYQADWVGLRASDAERPALAECWSTGRMVEGSMTVEGLPEGARMVAVPVRRHGRIIAVLTREWSPRVGRLAGELERTYLRIFERLTGMIAAGLFPFDADETTETTALPRVGDGVMALDAEAQVVFASPNAVSALHRVGINANATGHRLAELGFNDSSVRRAYEELVPVSEEIEHGQGVTLVTRCIPILADERTVTSGVLLVRDVTELRRRDRLLLTKDATIREIHHRVKNNLQTISSLLRLQGRRTTSAEAKAAIDESVRRIRTIALVHETLSREASDDVAFIEIVRPLARLAEDSLQSPDRPVRFRVVGDGGKLPATLATPLAVVLTELLQNAVDHAVRDEGASGMVAVQLQNDGRELEVRVLDDGRGLPPEFSLDDAAGLGLSIVRTLVTAELGGRIEMRPGTPNDFGEVGMSRPAVGTGTVVELIVPVGDRP